MEPVRVDLDSGGLLHSVLALLAPFDSNPSDEALLKQEVSGFLVVLVGVSYKPRALLTFQTVPQSTWPDARLRSSHQILGH